MIDKEYRKLRINDFITHKHFGLCIIVDINEIGLIISPLSIIGFLKLANWSGTLFNKILEHSKRQILNKVENPKIPKLIFKKGDEFEVHEWVNLGEVSNEGIFSSKPLGKFNTEKEALDFAGND